MLSMLTHEDFTSHLHSPFAVMDIGKDHELQLVEVKMLRKAESSDRRDQFSLLFKGNDQLLLPQRIYHLYHKKMGDLEIFLVPVGMERHMSQQGTYIYEAVFT